MRRILKYILLLLLILIPVKIFALSVDSDLIGVNKMGVNVEIGEIMLKNISFASYNNYKNTKEKGYVVNASFISSYDKEIDVKVILKLYDSAKNVLKSYENDYSLEKDKVTLYEIGEKYPAVDNIAFYSVYLEIITDVFEPQEEKILSDYYIDTYSSNIEINSNRVIKYSEELDVTFEHGNNFLKYYLPVKSIYTINNISISDNYSVELEKGINNITIGSKDKKFFNSNNIFKINYSYDMGKDYSKKRDSIEFDIVNSFTNNIKKGKFSILLPSEDGVDKISFFLNGKKTNLEYKVKGNRIEGSFGRIKKDEVLSSKIVFKEGYFTNTKSLIDTWLKIGLFLPISTLLVTIIVFLLIRDKKIMSKRIDLNLLTNYSSLEVGYLYNDKLDDKDIISMLLSLANKGYITIEKDSNGFVLNKEKDYEEDNEYEQAFLDGIFRDKPSIKEEQLYYMDNGFMVNIKNSIEKKYKSRFYNNFFNKYLLLIIICCFALFVITYRPLVVYDYSYLTLGVGLSMILFIILFFIINSRLKLIERVIAGLCVLVFYSFLAYFVILPALKICIIYMFIYVIGIICIIGVLLLYRLVPKRRRSSNILLRNINRLKKDIENSKDFDKELFLQLLPYAYVMDCYDKFANNSLCDDVIWYKEDSFVYWDFVSSIKDLLANVTYDLTHGDREGVKE